MAQICYHSIHCVPSFFVTDSYCSHITWMVTCQAGQCQWVSTTDNRVFWTRGHLHSLLSIETNFFFLLFEKMKYLKCPVIENSQVFERFFLKGKEISAGDIWMGMCMCASFVCCLPLGKSPSGFKAQGWCIFLLQSLGAAVSFRNVPFPEMLFLKA